MHWYFSICYVKRIKFLKSHCAFCTLSDSDSKTNLNCLKPWSNVRKNNESNTIWGIRVKHVRQDSTKVLNWITKRGIYLKNINKSSLSYCHQPKIRLSNHSWNLSMLPVVKKRKAESLYLVENMDMKNTEQHIKWLKVSSRHTWV